MVIFLSIFNTKVKSELFLLYYYLYKTFSVGEGKADWHLILSELEPEISRLTNNGFEYNGVLFKVKIVTLMADTVAKNSLLGMMGVGAFFGCSHCRVQVVN